jgi:lipoprotein NlpD
MNVPLFFAAESALFSELFTLSHRWYVKVPTVILLTAALIGCSTTRTAPVEERQPKIDDRVTISSSTPTTSRTGTPATSSQIATGKTYTVRQGETLYSIAQQNGVDYRELASWNNITDPSKLSVGQVLRLTPPEDSTIAASGVTTAPLQTVPPVTADSGTATGPAATARRDNIKTEPKAEKQPYSEQALLAMSRPKEDTTAPPPASTATTVTTPAPSPAAPPPSSPPTTTTPTADTIIDWSWPTQGKVISMYSEGASFKGIDIVGNVGQPVLAAAAGKVVYVGSGLRGYGKLVIVKHNDVFLSVYAHNRELLVQQGQQVTRGQKIAEMGNTDADQVKLHFEIRKDGKPIDPMQYLPPR